MRVYDWYVTPEEYEQAKSYGITRKNVDKRIRYRGWDKQRAITTPPRTRKKYPKEILELGKKNGITVSNLRQRVNLFGWDMYKAATTPLQNKKLAAIHAHSVSRKYPKKYIETARKNGIPDHVFYDRASQYGWSLEDACTKPVMTPREIGLMVKAKRQKTLDWIFCKNKIVQCKK